MNYVLFNDTSCTNNPGCHGTVACLRALLASRGMTCLRSHPVGFGEQRFRQSASPLTPTRSRFGLRLRGWLGRQAAVPIEKKTLGWDRPSLPFDRTAWETAALQLERDYDNFFTDVDVVVINGEGTIHHNLPGAAALVAWARAAARRGLTVLTVNCTIQALDPFLLDALFAASKRVAVREAWTFNDLQQHGYVSIQASDALFVWPDLAPGAPSTPPVSNRRRCVYSPGVLAAADAMTESIVGLQIQEMVKAGWAVSYLTIEFEDERFEAIARRAGASIYPLRRWTPAGLISMLREHDLVVSGRYHVIIFAWLAGRPVVPMMSNSWKVEGLLEMAGISPSSVHSPFPPLDVNSRNWLLPEVAAIDRLRSLALRNTETCL
jgi:Polysaccharide pyruvyl transferase